VTCVNDPAKYPFGRFEMCKRQIAVELAKFGNSESESGREVIARWLSDPVSS